MSYSNHDYGNASGGFPVRATVKWFNDSKGFGFVVPEDRNVDAFLHVTVLRHAGVESLGEGAQIVCTISSGPKGPQVDSVLEIQSKGTSSGNGPRSAAPGGYGGGYGADSYGDHRSHHQGPRHNSGGGYGGKYGAPRSGPSHGAPSGPVETISGTVKWYKPEKGFGFIVPDDGDRDIFIHKSCLDRAGLMNLATGQRVRIGVRTVPKGREVADVTLEK